MRYGKYIRADADICYGQPRIVGSGVRVVFVVLRLMAGETVKSIAADYGVPPAAVRATKRFVELLIERAGVPQEGTDP